MDTFPKGVHMVDTIVHLRSPENNSKTIFMMNGGSILLFDPACKKIVSNILVTIKKVAGLMTFGIFQNKIMLMNLMTLLPDTNQTLPSQKCNVPIAWIWMISTTAK